MIMAVVNRHRTDQQWVDSGQRFCSLEGGPMDNTVVGRDRSEGAALRGLDPCSIGMRVLQREAVRVDTSTPQASHPLGRERRQTHLPDHDPAVPALGLGLLHTRAERRGVHEPVGRVRGRRGLPDDEHVERDAALGDLEQRCARERAARGVDQPVTRRVQALVVELHVVLQTGVSQIVG